MLAALCGVSAFACALCAGLVVFGSATGKTRSMRMQQRVGAHRSFRALASPGPTLERIAAWVLALPHADALAQRVCIALRQRGVDALPSGVAAAFSCSFATLVVVGALAGRAALGLLLACALVLAVGAWANRAVEMRRERMRDSLPDALQSMSSCFGAGFTLLQTFSHLARELKGPLAEHFAQAESALRTGSAPTHALALMREQGGVEELSFVSVALSVQHQTGGSMQRVLDATRDSLKEELELKRSLRVQTAQAKLSARVVVGVTIGLVAAMMLLSKDFLDPFFASSTGMALLAVAVGMQVAGVALVRSLLNVKVE